MISIFKLTKAARSGLKVPHWGWDCLLVRFANSLSNVPHFCRKFHCRKFHCRKFYCRKFRAPELELDRESRSRPGFLVSVFLGPKAYFNSRDWHEWIMIMRQKWIFIHETKRNCLKICLTNFFLFLSPNFNSIGSINNTMILIIDMIWLWYSKSRVPIDF